MVVGRIEEEIYMKNCLSYSGKFLPEKNLAKAGGVVFRKHFGRFIFVHT